MARHLPQPKQNCKSILSAVKESLMQRELVSSLSWLAQATLEKSIERNSSAQAVQLDDKPKHVVTHLEMSHASRYMLLVVTENSFRKRKVLKPVTCHLAKLLGHHAFIYQDLIDL